jgi:hypothetical protein
MPTRLDLGEVVESVVDKLGDALPLIELNLSEHPEDSSGWSDLHERLLCNRAV